MSDEMQQQADPIDLRNGQRTWEGDHRVVLVSRDLPMNAELLIDGKGIRNTKRIEIDIDCDKPTPIVKLTQIGFDESTSGTDGTSLLREYTQKLTANLLNITLDEARVVDVILNKARQEASSNAMAVQLFSLDTETDDGERTRQTLDALIRDANRYRALRELIAEEHDAISLYTAQVHNQKPYDGDGLDQVADELSNGFAEKRRSMHELRES